MAQDSLFPLDDHPEMDIIYSKESLIQRLIDICKTGWIPNARPGNDGGIGNTLEDLLGIKENNLPLPNAAEWEIKSHRSNTTSLNTLFHIEPSPRALKIVPRILLPRYGWSHAKAGSKYPEGEKSFRQTISGLNRSDRGFMVLINRKDLKIEISFDSKAVDPRHKIWLANVSRITGLEDLNPRPYWGFDDLFHFAGTKIKNTFYVIAESRRSNKIEYFNYTNVYKLSKFTIDGILKGFENGEIYIDFDARTGHNHGTKFRIRDSFFPRLYESIEKIY